MKPLRAAMLALTCVVTSLAFAAPGDLDSTFVTNIGAGLTPAAYPAFDNGTGATNTVALQSNGKILAGGNVSRFNNTGALTSLKRLNADGTLDTTFNSGGAGLAASQGQSEVNVIRVDAQDRIYVGGVFDSYNGVARTGVLRLNADGTLDPSFSVTSLGGQVRYVMDVALLPNGQLLVSGAFTTINGQSRFNVARLNADGSVDTTFNANALGTGNVFDSVDVQADGKILVSGQVNNRAAVLRLHPDGSHDASFMPPFTNDFGRVNEFLILPDGRIVIGGDFDLVGQSGSQRLAALHPNGAVDATFAANLGTGPDGWAGGEITLQPDGMILVAGKFQNFNGQPRASIARLSQSGVLDPTFAPAPYTQNHNENLTHFYALAVQPDGKIVAGGWLNRVTDPALETYSLVRFTGDFSNGPGILRVFSTQAVTAENAGSVTLRVSRFGGIVGAATVNYTTSNGTATAGIDYTATSGVLSWADGEGGFKTVVVPILQDSAQEDDETFTLTLSGATGATLAPNAASITVTIRDDDRAPVITQQPASTSVDQGDPFTLSVRFDSVLPTTVQWQRDSGAGFVDIVTFEGMQLNYTIMVADPGLHAGNYRAVLTNANGSTTSEAVALTVTIPAGVIVPSYTPVIPAPVTAGVLDSSGRIVVLTNTVLRRIGTNGVTDPSFGHTFNNAAGSLLPFADGSLLVGGFFTTTNGSSTPYLARFDASGALDTTYAPSLAANRVVNTLAPAANNKFYVGHLSGGGLRRLNANGTLDNTFNAPTVGTGTNGSVYAVRELADGKVLVSHGVTSGFQILYRLERLNSDGSVDGTFTSPTLNWDVRALEVLPDGRIVAGGRYTTINGATMRGLAILTNTGALDPQFEFSAGAALDVLGVRYVDGRLLVWGSFTSIAGVTQGGIARVNLDGTLDPSFKVGSGANPGNVATALTLANGNLFVGGSFTNFRGAVRNYAAQLVGNAHVGAVGFAPARVTAVENSGTLTLTLRRYGPTTEAISLDYATESDSATAGEDFIAASGTVSWSAGDSADKTISITLINDAAVETTETFRVVLTNPTGAVTAAASATISIADDDTPVAFTQQPAGVSITEGQPFTLTAAATSPTAMTFQWYRNGQPIEGATSLTYAVAVSVGADHGTYFLRVTNAAGSTDSASAFVDITLNPAYRDPTWTANLTVNNRVSAIIPLPDGGAYVGGRFTNFNGQTGRSYLVRIDANGVIDTNFSPAPNGPVLQMQLVGDRLYVLGDFTGSFSQIGGGAAVSNFAALDATTGARIASFMTNLGSGANNTVRTLAVFPDGDVLLGGDFTFFNNSGNHRYVARINPDGTLHEPFNTSQATGTASLVVTAADIGADGKIVVGGTINYAGGVRFIRLNGDGSRDATFAPTATSASFNRIKVLADGRVMASGGNLPGGNRVFTRVSATGAWDSGEFFGATSGNVYDFALQTNGRSMAVGQFALVRQPSGNGSVSNIARYTAAGAYEGTWATGVGFDNSAYVIALAEDGRMWVGGDFTAYNGVAAQRLIRLNGDAIPLAITLQPKSLEVNPGATAVLTARATGTSTLNYQWRRNGDDVTNGGRISGATTATLTITDAAEADEGIYTLRVTNQAGEEISAPAELVVLGAPEILTQPGASVNTVSSRPFALEVTARGIAPLTFQWRKGGVALVEGANGITGVSTARLVFANLTLADAGDYDLVVSNSAGSTPSAVIALSVTPHPADRAAVFTSLNGGISANVQSILPLPDGGALLGGSFSISGANGTTSAGRIARVLSNGEVAALPFTLNGNVQAMHRLPDGKILIGGDFTLVTPSGGTSVTRNRIARLNADFTFDPTFDVGGGPGGQIVRAIKTDAAGRIYVGGSFPSWTGRPEGTYLVRLRSDGAIDPLFSAPLNNTVNDLEVDAQGRLLVAGQFTNYQGAGYLIRLLADGTRDTTFSAGQVATSNVGDIELQPDGKIVLIAGTGGVRRVLDTGALDATFPAVNQNGVATLALQADGSVLAGGSFTSYGGFPRGGLVRLGADGTVDPVLDIAGSSSVSVVRVDGYGRIWVGGNFTVFNNVILRAISVLNGDPVPLGFVLPPVTTAIEPGATAVFNTIATGTTAVSYQWLRNGVPLANGGRFSGATTATLTIAGVEVTDAATYSVEIANDSGTRVSPGAPLVVLGVPEILSAPDALTVDVGTNASFSVAARGAGTLSYQWFRDGQALTDGGVVSGATSSALTITGATAGETGNYSVRVTGSAGSTNSPAAALTVLRRPSGVARELNLPTFNSTVSAILPNGDGTFFAGGLFGTVTWNGGSASRARFAKINADGSADLTWPTFGNGQVHAIARDGNGRIYVGGTFTSVTPAGGSALTRNRLVRINADGSLDTAFNAPGGVAAAGPSGNVRGIKFDAQGRVYVYGEFQTYNGVTSGYIARLNADGSRDAGFVSPLNSFVYDVEFASDGRIWIGHGGTWSGQSRIVLVDDTGTRDPGFAYAGSMTANGIVLRADGSALSVSTNFPYLQHVTLAGGIVSGFPNTQFQQGTNQQISNHAAAGGGQVYLQGNFSSYASVPSANIVRINEDGSRDTAFDVPVGFNGSVDTMVVDSQGRVWIGGSFISYNGDTTLTRLIVLNGGAPQTFTAPPPMAAFDDYLSIAGVPEDQRGANDDPDGDGISNLLEYALDLDPMSASASGLPEATAGADRLYYTYVRARAELTYEVETSTNLTSGWTTVGVDQGTPDGDGVTTASVAMDGTARFFRLKVTRP